MYKRTFLAAAVLMALLSPTEAFAKSALPPEPAGFTLEVALARAIRNNPDIEAAEARVRMARIEKEQQDLWWARAVRGNANYVIGGNQFGNATVNPDGTVLPTAAIGVGLSLGDLLAGPKNSARAVEAITIAEAELRRTTLAVANQTTVAYQEYQAAKQMASFSNEMIEAAEVDYRVAERQFARGASQANSVLGTKLAVQRVKADSYQQSGNVVKAWSNLLIVMGSQDWVPARDAANADRR